MDDDDGLSSNIRRPLMKATGRGGLKPNFRQSRHAKQPAPETRESLMERVFECKQKSFA